MANVDSQFGFRPVRYLSGAPYTGAVNTYSTASGDGTAIYIGDPVTLAGTSQTINGSVYLDVAQSATGGIVVGVVVGVVPVTQDSTVYRAASTQRLLLVADSPEIVFEIQEVSGGTAFTANDAGLNANFVVAAGSAASGMSGVELNNAGENTTNTLDVQIVGFVNREGNSIGEHAKWLVRLNRHQYSNQVAGA